MASTLFAPALTAFAVPGSVPADPLAALHDALAAADEAQGLEARLVALLRGAHRLGLGAGAVVEHQGMTAAVLARVAAPDALPAAGLPAPVPAGAVWRRWLRLLERRRDTYGRGGVYALPLDDRWVCTEIGDPLCGGRGSLPNGLLVAPFAGAGGGRGVATLVADVPGPWPPAPAALRAVELLARYAGQAVEHERLTALAERRAERLQRLHEAGAALSRSLNEREIVRELGRHVARLVPADGVVVAHPDLERGVVRTAFRQVRGLARPRAEQPLGEGVLATVARAGTGLRLDDYDPGREPLARADDVVGDGGPAGSVLAAPMRVGTQLVGVVAAHAADVRAYSPEDEELLRTVASQAGTAIANARLYAESEAAARQSEALAEVARAVTGSLRLGEVLRLILRHTTGLLRAEGACVALRRDEFLHVVAGVGSAEVLGGVHLPVASSMMGRALGERRAIISNDMGGDPGYYAPLRRYATIDKSVLMPLYAGDTPIGVLAAINRGTDFAEADARMLERLGDHVGVAIANARLFEEVAAATRAWKVAFDAIAAGMVVLDEQGRVARCNVRAAELLGAESPKALLGAAFASALSVACHGGDGRYGPPSEGSDAPAEDIIRAAIERGETGRITLRACSGERVYDVTAAPHPDGGAVVTFDDVSEHHALADQLVQREKLAAVGRLVGGVAHELNNPLTAVLSLAELLHDMHGAPDASHAPSGAQAHELARAIQGEARRAAQIAGRLLAFAGQRPPERCATDVNRSLLDALELRRYALRGQGVDIALDLDYDLPATWADPHQLQQVFLNLVTSAEHAIVAAGGQRDGGRLDLRTRRQNGTLVVTVSDGVPPARVTSGDTSSGAADLDGEPVGLSISDGIVREHGGTLRVDADPRAGRTFVVELPIVEPPAAAPEADA